jgi:hypothetical protein
MASRNVTRSVRLATPAQLWVLNRAGRLLILADDASESEPINNADANAAIQSSMARAGGECEKGSEDLPDR